MINTLSGDTRMSTRIWIAAALALTAVGCGGGKDAGGAGGAAATKVSETPGMKTPESVRYDADMDVFFVSNINGNPSKKDGNGSITVIRADSTGVTRTLVESGKDG